MLKKIHFEQKETKNLFFVSDLWQKTMKKHLLTPKKQDFYFKMQSMRDKSQSFIPKAANIRRIEM